MKIRLIAWLVWVLLDVVTAGCSSSGTKGDQSAGGSGQAGASDQAGTAGRAGGSEDGGTAGQSDGASAGDGSGGRDEAGSAGTAPGGGSSGQAGTSVGPGGASSEAGSATDGGYSQGGAAEGGQFAGGAAGVGAGGTAGEAGSANDGGYAQGGAAEGGQFAGGAAGVGAGGAEQGGEGSGGAPGCTPSTERSCAEDGRYGPCADGIETCTDAGTWSDCSNPTAGNDGWDCVGETICAPRPIPLPGLSGAPIWSGTTGTVRQELDDPRWAAAPLTSFRSDVTETEAAYRVLVDGDVLSISWQALVGGDPTSGDAVYLGIGNASGTNAWVVQLKPPTSGVGLLSVSDVTVLHKSGATSSFALSADASEQTFLQVPVAWRKNHTNPAADLAVGADWAINAKINLADANLGLSSTNHFRLYLAMDQDHGAVTAVDYKMPDVPFSHCDSASLPSELDCVTWSAGGTVFTPVPVDTSTWADAWGAGTAGTPGAAQNECGGGVNIQSIDIETNNTPVDQINRDASVNGGTNTFAVTIHDIPPPVTTVPKVLARFSIADWGSAIADPNAPWDPLPGSSGYLPPATLEGTATWIPIDSNTARIEFTCAVQPGDSTCPQLPEGSDPNQSIMVELKKAPAQTMTFTRAVAYRSMSFGPTSVTE